jgi:hypothetical protein
MPLSPMPQLIVLEPSGGLPGPFGGLPISGPSIEMGPLEVHEEPEKGHHHHEHDHSHGADAATDNLEVFEPEDIQLVVEELPGAPAGLPDPEPPQEQLVVEEQPAEDEESKKPKKNEKWDWEARGATGFVAWIKERLDGVPKHSGFDSAGLERAMAYLDRLDSEISKAMRLDLDGELDANKIEEVRSQIDEGQARLSQRLDKVKKSKKHQKKRSKADFDLDSLGLIKEGQKITGVKGVYVMVPLLISRIARVCINGFVSAGHNIEDLYERQVKKWGLTDREQAEVMQLLADMGYPLRQDRGFMPDDDLEISDSDNMDWAANYKG